MIISNEQSGGGSSGTPSGGVGGGGSGGGTGGTGGGGIGIPRQGPCDDGFIAPDGTTGCTENTPPVIQKIYNNLTDSCLRQVLISLENQGLSGKMSNIINDVFNSNDYVNLTFNDNEYSDNGSTAKPAKSSVTLNNGHSFSENISINLAQVKGSSQEFAAILMMHEVLHAYMNYNNQYYLNQLKQHKEMAEKYVDDMKSLLQQIYQISDPDAYALILNGLSDAFGDNKPAYYQLLMNTYNVQDPLGVYELEKAGLSGTSCQTKN